MGVFVRPPLPEMAIIAVKKLIQVKSILGKPRPWDMLTKMLSMLLSRIESA